MWKEIYLHKTIDFETGLEGSDATLLMVLFKSYTMWSHDRLEFLKMLMGVIDKIELVEPDYVDTLKTACKYGITFYDAIYVQIAIDHSDTLVTEDKKLRKKICKDIDVLSVNEIL